MLFVISVENTIYAMKTLTLNTFTSSLEDIEKSQYKILSSLKDYRTEFNKNRLYPALTELTYLYSTLEELLAHKACFDLLLPNGISNKNYIKNNFIEIVDQTTIQNDYVYDLIEWALPLIQNLIDEAKIIYDFVLDNLSINQKGVSNIYDRDGYLLIPDNCSNMLNVYKFETVENYRDNKSILILNTEYLQSTKMNNLPSISWFIEMELMKKYNNGDDANCYLLQTDLDFPFIETMFPLAKVKLLNYLSD